MEKEEAAQGEGPEGTRARLGDSRAGAQPTATARGAAGRARGGVLLFPADTSSHWALNKDFWKERSDPGVV